MADAMQVGFRTVDGVRVRYAESTGPAAPSSLLTSPASDVRQRGPDRRERIHALRPMWEEQADEYAARIADWVTGAYREAAARGPTAAVMSPATDGGNDELEQ